MHVAILGAGAIGCHVGAAWSRAAELCGGRVTLVGRPATLDPIGRGGLRLTGAGAGTVPAGALATTDDPAALGAADLVVLAMKAPALPRAIAEILLHAPPAAPVLSLLNGVAPVRELRAALPGREVIAGMVPYNVVWQGPAHLHRSGPGEIALGRHRATERLAEAGAAVAIHDDVTAVQYGKLLLNLANPVNALAARPLRETLLDRGYRRVLAAAIAEALHVYRGAGVAWRRVGPSDPRLAVAMLRAPTWLFRRAILDRQQIDGQSMTSMAGDLLAGRITEIDILSGEIVRLGARHGIAAPVNGALTGLVNAVERGDRAAGFAPGELLSWIRG